MGQTCFVGTRGTHTILGRCFQCYSWSKVRLKNYTSWKNCYSQCWYTKNLASLHISGFCLHFLVLKFALPPSLKWRSWSKCCVIKGGVDFEAYWFFNETAVSFNIYQLLLILCSYILQLLPCHMGTKVQIITQCFQGSKTRQKRKTGYHTWVPSWNIGHKKASTWDIDGITAILLSGQKKKIELGTLHLVILCVFYAQLRSKISKMGKWLREKTSFIILQDSHPFIQ